MNIKYEELRDKLLNDLNTLGIKDTDFDLVLRGYSKTMYGSYSPYNNRIVLYVYMDSNYTYEYPYISLFETFLHEVVHYLQYKDPDFVRLKGVMHNPDFYNTFNFLMKKAKRKKLI